MTSAVDDETGRVANLDDVDLLTLWRTVPIEDVDKALVWRLAGAMIGHARTLSEPPDPELLLRAQARDHAAWIELADRYPPHPSGWVFDGANEQANIDRHASCLFVAASLGSKWSAARLALRIAQVELRHIAPVLASRILGSLGEIYTLRDASVRSTLRYLDVLDEVSGTRAQSVTAAPAPSKDPVPSEESPPPGIRVILETPEKTADRDLKVLHESLSVLEKPVALKAAPSPKDLAAALMLEFPWAVDAISEITTELMLARRLGVPAFRLPAILLVGDPGIGKTRFIRRLSQLAEIPSATLMAGGASDSRSLSGTSRGWSTATPSFPLTTIRRFLVANPIIVVEEIDKAGGSDRNGRMADRLMSMLDPALAQDWLDECLQVPINISWVTWILTANRLDRVPPNLRGRCRILNFPRPRPVDFEVLFAGILRDIAEGYGTEIGTLPELDDEVVDRLRSGFASGRLQARQLAALVRRALGLQVAADAAQALH